jgi:hypothetical protein
MRQGRKEGKDGKRSRKKPQALQARIVARLVAEGDRSSEWYNARSLQIARTEPEAESTDRLV